MPEQENSTEFAPLQPFSISARIGRVRFMAYMATVLLCMVVIVFGEILILGESFAQFFHITFFFNLFLMIILFVCSGLFIAKRFRDFGAPGFLAIPATFLLMFPPTYLLIIGVLSLVPGRKTENKYGPPPPPNSKGSIILSFSLVIMIIINLFTFYSNMKMIQQFIAENPQLQQQFQSQQNQPETPALPEQQSQE